MRLSCKPISVISILFVGALIQLALVAPLQATSLPLFGPEKFGREAGAPETFSRTFAACNIDARYRLVMENGAAGKDRVSAATISLNGVDVVRPSDLNQRVERIEKEVALQGENTLAVRLASNPGGFLNVSLFCVSGCLDLEISSPTPGSTVNGARALVQGSLVNASGEVGVVLTSAGAEGETAELAQVQGDHFAGLVPLQPGENILTATATDACGNQVQKSITTFSDSVSQKVEIGVLPANGVLTAVAGVLEAVLAAEVEIPVLNYEWDIDGDGTVDRSGANLTEVTVEYHQARLYFPTLVVTDEQGKKYGASAVIAVSERAEINTLLNAKWSGMRKNLSDGAIEKALAAFSAGSQGKYRNAFTKLEPDLKNIAREMRDVELIEMSDRSAKCRITREQEFNGQIVTISYYVYFEKDANSIWKIDRF